MSIHSHTSSSIRTGWIITAFAFMMLMISNGMTLSGLSVFDKVIIKDLQCTREQLKLGELIQLLVAGTFAPFVGMLADRYGLKLLVTFGLTLLSIGFFFYGDIQSLSMLYLLRGVFGLALACAGLIMAVLMVSQWFQGAHANSRGLAVGIALVGSSLGNTFFAILNARFIELVGWRDVFSMIAGLPLLLAIVAWFIVKKPMETEPSSTVSHQSEQGSHAKKQYWQAISSLQFWIIALSAMLTFYTILGVSSHLPLYLQGTGQYTLFEAGKQVGFVFLMSLFGKLVWGWLADRFSPRRLFAMTLLIMEIGALLLWSMNLEYLSIALVLFGFGWGGLYTMIQLLVVGSFELNIVGRVLGTITFLDALGGGLGPWLTAKLYGVHGNYQLPFLVIAIMIAIVLSGSFLLKPLRSESHLIND